MTVADTLAMAWSNLDRRKGRTALTAAGVVIGVGTLVLMVSLALGLQRQVTQLFETDESLRTLRVHRVKSDGVRKKGPSIGFGFDEQMVPLTDKDLEAIRKVPDVAGAWPEFNMFLRVSLEGGKGTAYPVEGIAPEEEAGYKKYVVAGSMWTNRDERVCLVPKSMLESHLNLRLEDAVGRKATFSGLVQEADDTSPEDVFTIAGVLSDEAFSFMGRPIMLPLDQGLTLRERRSSHPLLPSKRGSYLFGRLRLKDPRAAQDVAARLRNMGFNPLSAVELLKKVNIFFFIVEGLMSCIGAIGLVVSLFGIANTMAMAVLERTREIGIMKALGARNGDIGRLFLAEAGAIGALGGIVGLGGGALIGKLLNMIAHPLFDLPANVNLFHVSLWLALGSVLFAVAVSVLAGWIPARRAAKMEPVAAVRYE